MKDLIIDIFGEYVPNSYSVTLPDNGGYDTIIPNGLAGVDIVHMEVPMETMSCITLATVTVSATKSHPLPMV